MSKTGVLMRGGRHSLKNEGLGIRLGHDAAGAMLVRSSFHGSTSPMSLRANQRSGSQSTAMRSGNHQKRADRTNRPNMTDARVMSRTKYITGGISSPGKACGRFS